MRPTITALFRPAQLILRPQQTQPNAMIASSSRAQQVSPSALLDRLFATEQPANQSGQAEPASGSSSPMQYEQNGSDTPSEFEALFATVQQPQFNPSPARTAADIFDDERNRINTDRMVGPFKFSPDQIRRRRPPITARQLLPPSKNVVARLDPFILNKVDPLDHYLSPSLVFSCVNPTGGIKPRRDMMLSHRSQRKIAKLIRRSRAMGLTSPWSDRAQPGGYGDGLPPNFR